MEVDNAEAEILESGTSLAEEEFGEERAPLIVNNNSITNVPTETGDARNHTGIFHNSGIEALRSEIADDVLVASDGNSLFCFSSPFEMPRGAVDLNSNSNENEEQEQDSNMKKYLQVPMVYCDQTASNKPLQSIERYMEKTCLPFYGNTHTNTSITGAQSTALVAEARQIVAEATNARITGKASLDVVLFTGNGTTSAVETLIDCLGLKYACADASKRPVVFIGPYEHHSNLIPWREAGCEIVPVPESPTSNAIDYQALEKLLQNPRFDNRLKMGTFTAASNVTGKVSDVDRIAAMLHRYGALAFFDYATGAPYMSMDMNPSPSEQYPTASLVAKDAIFFSPHKMIGGIGTPGVLVVKKHLVHQQNAPSRSGGGTVFYVTNTHHRFLSSRIDRYEGGTPNVSGIQRVGLAFLFKRQVEQKFRQLASSSSVDLVDTNVQTNESYPKNEIPHTLQHYEYSTYDRAIAFLREHALNIHLLDVSAGPDNQQSPHLPIFSFLIKCGNRFLHFNYVCAILNDVFGIQSRGGCQCAGPYSQRLLGLTKVTKDGDEVPNKQNEAIEHALLNCKERAELLRPGYTRLSLPFKGLRTEEVEYVLNALVWTAKNGWALMCKYRCNHRTGEWRHANRQGKPLGTSERKWLSHYNMFSQQITTCTTKSIVASERREALENALANADLILKEAISDQRSIVQASKMHSTDVGPDSDMLEKLRWYMHPKECASCLTQGIDEFPSGSNSGVLEGAVNPLCCFSGLKPEYTVASPWHDTTVVVQPVVELATGRDRKRKQTNSVSCDEIESDNKNLLMKRKDTVGHFYFRDGEHSGEASFDEISAGFDDEELSEECQILDKESGGWIPIETFLMEGKQSKNLLPTDGEVANAPQSQLIDRSIDSTLDTAELDAKNSNKKPARGSTSWGQGDAVSGGSTFEASKADTAQQDSQARTNPEKKKFKRFSHVKPPAKIMRLMTQAIIQWKMLEEGDKLLLGLSGGKDSLSLLHCLLECRRKLPIHFEIEVCTIDPMTPSFDPSPLIPYMKSLGLTYHYIRDDIVSRANSAGKDGKTVSSLCAYCARMKRGNLYTCARQNKCNKLVLAQHLDDCAESFLMSVMHNGFLRTMKANYKIDAGDLTVLRPLIYCRESLMTDFAKSASLPVINENCPACFEEPKERARVKKLLSREESLYPHFYDNIRRSLIPLMHDDMSSILRGYTEEVVRRSRKEPQNGNKKHRKNVSADSGMPIETTENARQVSVEQATVENKILFDHPLANASDDALVMELALRKATRFRQTFKRGEDDGDPTGQVCSLNGGNGTIPCRELME